MRKNFQSLRRFLIPLELRVIFFYLFLKYTLRGGSMVEYTLLFQGTPVQLPAPMSSSSQPPVTLSRGANVQTLLDFMGTYTHTHTHS